MNIQKVKLRGFIGIQKGLGLNELEIDFSGYDGLIALSGPTGQGKSTIMENLHPYPQLVSRPQPALKNHVLFRDSMRELTFTHGGRLFETRIKIDSESGRSEGFLYIDGKPEVNGKISEYSRAIEHHFGSANLFFNSVFCAQNSTKISGLRPAELKALFAEFLGPRLDQLVAYENASKQCISSISGMSDAIDRDIQRQKAVVESHEDSAADLARKSMELRDSERGLADMGESMATAEKALEESRKAMVEQEKAEARANDLRQSLAVAQKETADFEAKAEAELSVIRQKARAISLDIDGLKAKLVDRDQVVTAADRAKSIERDIPDAEVDLSDAQAIAQDAQTALHRGEMELARADMEAQEKRSAVKDELAEANRQADALKESIAKYNREIESLDNDPEIARIKREIEFAKSQAVALDKRDPECKSETCSFIVVALLAKESLRILAEDLTSRSDEIAMTRKSLSDEASSIKYDLEKADGEVRELSDRLVNLAADESAGANARMQALAKLRKEADAAANAVVAFRERLSALKTDLQSAKAQAERLPEIQEAEAKLQPLEARKEELISEGTLRKVGWDQAIGEKKAQVESISKQIFEIESMIDPAAGSKVTACEKALKNIKEAITATTERISTLRAEVSALEKSASERAVAEKELDRLIGERKRLAHEAVEWAYIKDACGANGLRALEIEAVAPSITHDANQLLERAFGAWAMVDFRTQDADGKEVLEPRVIDKDGDSVLIGNRSGGQQVWALKALRLAMTMISKVKSGRDFRTAYADEDDAGLDVDTAQSFTKLYQVFMGLGGFEKCFMITHKRECVELADHVLRLERGGVTIQ